MLISNAFYKLITEKTLRRLQNTRNQLSASESNDNVNWESWTSLWRHQRIGRLLFFCFFLFCDCAPFLLVWVFCEVNLSFFCLFVSVCGLNATMMDWTVCLEVCHWRGNSFETRVHDWSGPFGLLNYKVSFDGLMAPFGYCWLLWEIISYIWKKISFCNANDITEEITLKLRYHHTTLLRVCFVCYSVKVFSSKFVVAHEFRIFKFKGTNFALYTRW